MRKQLLLLAAGLCVVAVVAAITAPQVDFQKKKTQTTTPVLKAGDIVFQSTDSKQCEAVKAATGSEWSHCGIVLPHNNHLMVLEAVQPVQWVEMKEWLGRSTYKVCRLKADSLLTSVVIDKMVNYGSKWAGSNYDIYFNWSDEEWYCSELVWKIYNDALGISVGDRKKLRDYHLDHPLVKKIMEQRYGTNPPLDEWMISPGAIAESKILIEVK